MPTNSDFDGYFHGIGKIPLFTYGMIGVTTIVLGYMTYLDSGNLEEADKETGNDSDSPIQTMIPETPTDLSLPTNDFSNPENNTSQENIEGVEGSQQQNEGTESQPDNQEIPPSQDDNMSSPDFSNENPPEENPSEENPSEENPSEENPSEETPEKALGGKKKSKRKTKRRKTKSI